MEDVDIRREALEMAQSFYAYSAERPSPEEVVARAEVYAGFLNGLSSGPRVHSVAG